MAGRDENYMEKIAVLAVVGPTASGKTRLGISLAKKLNGEIVSADSMQIYRGMNIATAKPTLQERETIPHHLVDFLDPASPFSVAEYVALAKKAISQIHASGKLPVIVGGTGLYVNSLLDNISFCESPVDYQRREYYLSYAKQNGSEALWQKLNEIDSATAQELHPNNIGRIARALECYDTTGIRLSEQKKFSRTISSPYYPLMFGINCRERSLLYERINRRIDEMMKNGLLQEAELYACNPTLQTSAQAIGYKELRPYFERTLPLEDAVENLKRETRRYAKRQLTWFRRDERIHWLYLDDYSCYEELETQAEKMAADFLAQNI